jgi:hypothetical protein
MGAQCTTDFYFQYQASPDRRIMFERSLRHGAVAVTLNQAEVAHKLCTEETKHTGLLIHYDKCRYQL